MAFSLSFDGQQVSVGSLKFKVTKAFIFEATGLPMAGERRYKKKTMRIGDFTAFLKPQYSMVDQRCGIPASWLKEDWQQVLKIVQKFITCEGCFSIAHLYQMRLLTHITCDDPLNLVHYLYNSFLKMSKRYQKQPLSSPQYVYHRGLIKILVQYQLNKKGKSWDEFLLGEGFQGMSSKKKMGHPKSKRRVNLQEEEKGNEPSSHSHNQDDVEQESPMQKSSSLGRLT